MVKPDELAFDGCDALTTIRVPKGMTDYYKDIIPEDLHDLITEYKPRKRQNNKNKTGKG
jgi:hypothetical protein